MENLIKAILKEPNPINPIRDIVKRKFKEDGVECILNQAIGDPSDSHIHTLKLLLSRTIKDDWRFADRLEVIMRTLNESNDWIAIKPINQYDVVTDKNSMQMKVVSIETYNALVERFNALEEENEQLKRQSKYCAPIQRWEISFPIKAKYLVFHLMGDAPIKTKEELKEFLADKSKEDIIEQYLSLLDNFASATQVD